MRRRSEHPSFVSWIFVVITALFFGLIGGKLSDRLDWPPKTDQAVRQSTNNTLIPPPSVVAEDEAVVKVVQTASPAVVSIVISKDVPRLRRNPFPFFFDPFNSDQAYPDDSQDSSGSSKQKIGSGSGFLVSGDGLIVTNRHVVDDEAADYTVITNDGAEHGARVLARDPNNDLAVIKIDGDHFPALTLGDSDRLRVGETAIAIGNPLGQFNNSVSRGIISGLGRNLTAGSDFNGEAEKLSNIIQTDAAINPGNSGGPLLNLASEVIGVNVAVAQGAENIGFAIPVNSIKRAVSQVKESGRITTAYLGVRYIILNAALQKENSLPYNYGALVLRGDRMTDFAVVPGSPADKAGLVENDIILEIDGKKIDDDTPLAQLINQKNVGDEIVLKVWHKGDVKEVRVRLEERKQ